jgi:hypothetical protein
MATGGQYSQATWHPADIAKRQAAFRVVLGGVGALLAWRGFRSARGAKKWVQLAGGGVLLVSAVSPTVSKAVEHRLSARSRADRVEISESADRKDLLQMMLGQRA